MMTCVRSPAGLSMGRIATAQASLWAARVHYAQCNEDRIRAAAHGRAGAAEARACSRAWDDRDEAEAAVIAAVMGDSR